MLVDRRAGGQCAVGLHLLTRGVERGPRGRHGVARVRDVLGRHGARIGNRLAAAQIVLRTGEIGLFLRDVRGIQVVVHVQAAHLPHGLPQRRFGVAERDFRIGVIERDDRVARLHDLRIVGIHRHDGAGHLRRQLHEIAADVSVVRRFVVARIRHVVHTIRDRRRDDRHAEQRQQQPASSRSAFACDIVAPGGDGS